MENIDIDIDIDKDNLKNIDIDIDIDMALLENIDIDIDKGILQNIEIDKISYRLGFGISNTPTTVCFQIPSYFILTNLLLPLLRAAPAARYASSFSSQSYLYFLQSGDSLFNGSQDWSDLF